MITIPPAAVIAQWISDNTTRMIGCDLFVSLMPDNPDDVLATFDVVGRRDGRCHMSGHEVLHYGVTLQGRSDNYPTMFAELAGITNGFNQVNNAPVSVNGVTVSLSAVTIVSGPFYIGSSEVSNTSMFSINLLASISEI